MAQFDIYRHDKGGVAFLVDLQDEMLEGLSTRIVAPLVTANEMTAPMNTVNPRVVVNGQPYILMSHLLAAIPLSSLGKPVCSAKEQRGDIIAALDLLFTGI